MMRRSLLLFAVLSFPALSGELEDLKLELANLKKEYEARIAKLEGRLQDLAQGQALLASSSATIEKQVETTRLAADEARKLAEENRRSLMLLGATPLFDKYDPSKPAKDFEFHGYARSGFGLNERGGQQQAFKAPGADAKYRLGNEAETYAEMALVNNWLNPEREEDKAWFKTEVMIQAATSNLNSFDPSSSFHFREAFAQAGNVLPGRFAQAKFWAGQRYYRRFDIHINDFWMLDMSGYGGGVEDVPAPKGKLALAYIGAAIPTTVTATGNVPKSNIDFRWYGLKAPGGEVGVWYNYAASKVGLDDPKWKNPNADGHAFGFGHKRTEFYGGYHQFSFQVGTGAASNLVATAQTPSRYWQDAKVVLLTDHALLQPTAKFAIMPSVVMKWYTPGDPGVQANKWLSFGARPVWYFSKYVSLAAEPGFDYVNNPNNGATGWVRKFTVAPQIGAGREFFSRPVLRLFATYANWSDALRGQVGGTAYQNRRSGFSAGVQMESWW